MTYQPTEQLGLPSGMRTIALLILIVLSGGIVWSFHYGSWATFLVTIWIGGLFGFLAAGLVGVHIFPAFGTMAGFAGLFEGCFQGWTHFGLIGAILGGPIGILVGSAMAILPLMFIHLGLVMCGIKPWESLDSSIEKQNASP